MSKEKALRKKEIEEGIERHSQSKTKKKTIISKKEFDSCGIELTEKQNDLYNGIKRNTMTLIHGPAGTSKTFTSCYAALALLANKKIDKIIITKPMEESGNSGVGFLPGNIEEKTAPYKQSFLSNFAKIIGVQNLGMLISTGDIVFEPLAYMRGSTYDHCLIQGEIVYTKKGEIKIEDIYEDIQKGIFYNVLSRNEETEELEYKELSMIRRTEVEEYIELETEDGVKSKISSNHKFYTTKGLKESKDLNNEDEIISINSNKSVKSVKKIKEKNYKFSINVEDNHNYFSTGKLLSKNCIMLLDEAQNCSIKDLMLWSTRLGKDSYAVILGDTSQYDVKSSYSGFSDYIKMTDGMDKLFNFKFENSDIVRNKFLIELTNRYDIYRSKD